jgi:DNA-binding IclR family transcriptional regulator
VLLAVRDGDELVFVERLSGPDAIPVLTAMGRRRSLHASSAGLALLAHAEPERQERVLSSSLRRYTPNTMVDPTQLRSELDRIRRNGFAVSNGHMSLSALSVAAPVRDRTDGVVASISVVVPVQGADHRRLAPAVVAAARGVSRALGAPSAQQTRRRSRQGMAG